MKSPLYETYRIFEVSPSRPQERMVQILEAAIRSYASVGVEETSFERVSKACKVSRPLIHHYFKSKRELFITAVKYVRSHLQGHVVEAIKAHRQPREQLAAYVAAHLDWIDRFPDNAAVATLFHYYCAIDKKLRRLNTELVDMGHDRIAALLTSGVETGAFPPMDVRVKAKSLQLFLTGLVVSLQTEAPKDPALLRSLMVKECEALVM